MKRSQIARLRDMLEQIDLVAEMTETADLASYRQDVKLRRAV